MAQDLILSKSLDLNGHDIKNLYPHRMASDPTGLTAAEKGLMWFNTTDNATKYWTGAEIIEIGAPPDLSGYSTTTQMNTAIANAIEPIDEWIEQHENPNIDHHPQYLLEPDNVRYATLVKFGV